MELLLGLLILAAASYFSYLYFNAKVSSNTTNSEVVDTITAVEETITKIETEVVEVVKKTKAKAASLEDEVKAEVAKVKATRKPRNKTTK